MNQRILRAAVAGCVTLGLAVGGCAGVGEITADTTCEEYLQRTGGERHDAAVRISSEMDVSSAGNPMWGMSLDQACGSNPDRTVGDYFARQR